MPLENIYQVLIKMVAKGSLYTALPNNYNHGSLWGLENAYQELIMMVAKGSLHTALPNNYNH